MPPEHVILLIRAEGGTITVRGIRSADGWRFSVGVEDWMAAEVGIEGVVPPVEPTATWDDTLRALDRYPWARLYPKVVHPEFRDRVLAAVSQRLSATSERDLRCLARWQAACDLSLMREPRADALYSLLATAQAQKWCVWPRCSTCGAMDYRRAIQASREELISALRAAPIHDLQTAFPDLHVESALRLLMMELDSPTLLVGPPGQSLDERLASTDAGRYLAHMRVHHRDRELAAERHAAEHDPAVMAERRLVRQRARDARQQARSAEKATRECAQSSALAEFLRLSLTEQLLRLADADVQFPLYRLPLQEVQRLSAGIPDLSDIALQRIRVKVPVTSVRPLALLSRAIEKEVRARVRH